MHSSISIRDLTKRFKGGVVALDGVSLEVPAGSIFGFLGVNGAGKTTALRILAGLTTPTSGTVEVDGLSLDAGVEYRRHVGYLAQEPQFYGWMTGRQTLRYVAGFNPGSGETAEERIGELLALAGLDDAADRRTAGYSAGMRQRLGLAQALIGRPSVLLLDEPVSALDPIGRHEILEMLAGMRGTTTILYSTHILDDIERVADHVAIIHHGSLLVAAPTAELLRTSGGRDIEAIFLDLIRDQERVA